MRDDEIAPHEWVLEIYDEDTELVRLTGLVDLADSVAVSVALTDAGYRVKVGHEHSSTGVLVQRVADGLMVVAGKGGKDIPNHLHPMWVRRFRREIKRQTGDR